MQRKTVRKIFACILMQFFLFINSCSCVIAANEQNSNLAASIQISNQAFKGLWQNDNNIAFRDYLKVAQGKKFLPAVIKRSEKFNALLKQLENIYGTPEGIIQRIKSEDGVLAKAVHFLQVQELRTQFPDWVIKHQEEVLMISYGMGVILGFRKEHLRDLAIAARFHDIGKCNINPMVINYNGFLLPEQRDEIVEHAHQSYMIMKEKGITSSAVLWGAFYHHENYDGTGYPDKLSAEAIPIEAKIIRVADSFCAILGKRPYPHKNSYSLAYSEIISKSGKYYDPMIVKVFDQLIRPVSFRPILNQFIVNNLQKKLSSFAQDQFKLKALVNFLSQDILIEEQSI